MDSRVASDQVTRQGLVRLLRILHKKSVRAQVSGLPNIEQHALKLARIIPSKELRKQLGDLIVRIAFVHLKKIPRTADEFETLQQGAREKLSRAAHEVSRWLPRLSASVHQAFLQMEDIPAARSPVKGDLRSQISLLTEGAFFSETSWDWLVEYPRFFEAIGFRVDKLSSTSVDKDKMQTAEIEHYLQQYHDMRQRHEAQSLVDPELDQFRWMIEEYRVSLFAQSLGTSITVSAKRLEKQFAKVRQV